MWHAALNIKSQAHSYCLVNEFMPHGDVSWLSVVTIKKKKKKKKKWLSVVYIDGSRSDRNNKWETTIVVRTQPITHHPEQRHRSF